MYEVLRPFTAEGKDLKAGDIVEGKDWRTLRQLQDQRYLREKKGKGNA